MTRFSWIDYSLFVVYLVASVLIGVLFVKEQKTVKDFFLAGRSMGRVAVAISVLAAIFSGITYLGAPAEVYAYGAGFFLFFLSFFIATPITNMLFMPVFYHSRMYTAYQYLEERFSVQVRLLSSAMFILRVLLWLGLATYAPALALEQVTGLPLWFTILCTGTLTTIYTTLGGMKAVIWTDIMQFFVLFGGQLVIMFVAISQVPGGLGGMIEMGREANKFDVSFSFDPNVRLTLWAMLLGGAAINLVQMATDQVSVQRYLTSRSMKEAQRSLWLKLWLLLPVLIVFYVSGLAIWAFYRVKGDPLAADAISKADYILPYFVINELPRGMPGLLIAAIFAASMSTISAGINALTTATLVDFHQRGWRKSSNAEGVKLSLARWLTLTYGGLVIGLAFVVQKLGSLLEASNKAIGMVGGPLLGLFLLGILVKRANTMGAIIGWVAGVAALVPVCFFNTTFQVPLDWADGGNASWQERAFVKPITCRAIRFKLESPGGVPPVQLTEWRLFLSGREPVLFDVAKALADGQATVTHSKAGPVLNLFDGNENTSTSMQSTNLSVTSTEVITLEFSKPKRLIRSGVYVVGEQSQWRIETADSVNDLDAMTNVPFQWAKTSFLWYGVIGCGVTMLIGWLASLLFPTSAPPSPRTEPRT